MNILIVSATVFEVKPLVDFLEIEYLADGIHQSNKQLNGKQVQVLITGVGMVNTAFMMGRYMNSLYDLVLNVGVCGAFDKNLALGQLVYVSKDIISEMGAEDGEDFLTYDKLNLPGNHVYDSINTNKYIDTNHLKQVKGITVNTVHGNNESIKKVINRYHPDVESMEGAAFFAGCQRAAGDVLQIRAVSNYVEKRDKSKWEMPLAIKNLNNFLIQFLNE